MQSDPNQNVAARVKSNPHFARLLRQRLESRHGAGALRETLAQLTDQELVDVYLRHEQQGRVHAAKRRAEKEVSL
jgi:hypothetical protein